MEVATEMLTERTPKRLGRDLNQNQDAKKPKTKNVSKYLRPAPQGKVIRVHELWQYICI